MVRRHYTPDLATRSLPLVSRIAADVQATALAMQATWHRLRAQPPAGPATPAAAAERAALQAEFESLRERFEALIGELEQMGVELKDPMTGLLDFRARRGSEDVYLCWRLGEDSVTHWHTLQTGFAGRRPMAEF